MFQINISHLHKLTRDRAGWAEERLQTDKLARSEDYWEWWILFQPRKYQEPIGKLFLALSLSILLDLVHLAWLFELSDIDMNGITDRIAATELGQPDTLTCDGLVIVMTTDQSQGWGYNLYNELWHWLSAWLIWELCPGVGTISISVIMRSEPQALVLTKVSVPCPDASWCDHDHPML